MPRHARAALSDNEFFHVMLQGLNRETIFGSDHYKDIFFSMLVQYKDQFDVKLLAYCIMDNHCHLLLHAQKLEAMSDFMRKVDTKYAQYYNFKQGRVGYVFRDRFKCQPITDEDYLMQCLVYIHQNPVKAAIVAYPEAYRHSSYQAYISGKGFVDFDDAAQLFDTSPVNIKAIHAELADADSDIQFIDVPQNDDDKKKNIEAILSEIDVPFKYLKTEKEQFHNCIKRLSRAGMKNIEIAQLFGVSATLISRVVR